MEYPDFTFRAGMLALKDAEVDETLLEKFNSDRICVLEQISTDKIIRLDFEDLKRLSPGINKLGSADALIVSGYKQSEAPKTLIGITTADCLPVIIHSEDQLAIIHAGWRGLALNLIQKAIRQIKIQRACKVHIGAAAKGCCYEVGKDVLEALQIDTETDRKKIDLQHIAAKIFQELLPDAKISIDSRCTICSNELHSYRRDKTKLRNFSFVII